MIFPKKNVAELYQTTLNCLPIKNHLLTFTNFINGQTLLGFQLVNYDDSADIISPLFGVLKINLKFGTTLADPAVAYILGEALSVLSINYNRDIILIRFKMDDDIINDIFKFINNRKKIKDYLGVYTVK